MIKDKIFLRINKNFKMIILLFFLQTGLSDFLFYSKNFFELILVIHLVNSCLFLISSSSTAQFLSKIFAFNYLAATNPGKLSDITVRGNDSYIFRRYVNKNGEKVKESMFKLSDKLHTGVWDMYSVMGGLNSIILCRF